MIDTDGAEGASQLVRKRRRWKIQVLQLAASIEEEGEKEVAARETLVRDLESISDCNVYTWPEPYSESGTDTSRWPKFWGLLRREQRRELQDPNGPVHVLVIVSLGPCDGSYYLSDGCGSSTWYRVRADRLADAVVDAYTTQQHFQVVVLAGEGTDQVGTKIDARFKSLPVQPPCILCWPALGVGKVHTPALDGTRFRDQTSNQPNTSILILSSLGKVSVNFLRKVLEGPVRTVDLRATTHSFVRLYDSTGCATYLPRWQVDKVHHVFYRLGLSAYELARRLAQVVDNGMILRFSRDEKLSKRLYGRETTVFLFAEFFGWLFVLRQQPAQLYYEDNICELEWSFSGENHKGVDKQDFQLLKFDIRAMGEAMVRSPARGEHEVLSWLEFKQKWQNEAFRRVFEKLEYELDELEKRELYLPQAKMGEQDETVLPVNLVLTTTRRNRLVWVNDALCGGPTNEKLCGIIAHYASELSTIAADAPQRMEPEGDEALKQKMYQKKKQETQIIPEEKNTVLALSSEEEYEWISQLKYWLVDSNHLSPTTIGWATGMSFALIHAFIRRFI